MATGKHIPCGPCSVDDVTKNAWRWCTSCEEGLCEDCEHVHRRSKSSRNHRVISIEDYSKIENVSISQICEHHGENLEWFCKSHDEVLCVVCVPSKHKACFDVIPISVNSANLRQSSGLSDLEETIEGTLRNVKQCIRNRESATKEIEKQELEVKTMVLDTRAKINGQLDKLQEKLLHELRSTSQTCKSKYMKILQKLKSTEEMLTKLREQSIHTKQFSSDIQVFLGMRQVNKQVGSEVESIKNEISVTKDFTLKITIDGLIEKLSNEVEEFGKIFVSESATNLEFRDPKLDQAQIEINVPTTRDISKTKLQLHKSFQITSTNTLNVAGCVILPNGNLLMANATKDNQLIEYSDAGEHIRDIPVSDPPCDIAVLDLDRIVVTYENASYIEIINRKTFNVEKKISLQYSCLKVSQEDGLLYVVYGKDKIQVMDLSGKQIETLKITSEGLSCVKTSRQKIFYANYNTKQVHCCRLNGEELWKFECDSIKFPYDITSDSYHNVYVADSVSKSLTIVQHDGKYSKTLLTESDGLNRPTAVDFDTDKRTLLICNAGGNVALYNVV
ncbi:E3 ubiquitin-protein ligase TRIM22-like [Mytilus trossulus]|uniref:E3 ubiquitin-protein ligase TRIM22-like n=1 Tax=Mytilus trossulus TaxID=6551 RepID=UPI0030055CD1